MAPEKSIPVVLGPTASGKTKVGIELCKLIDGEVISVDSRKVYEGLPVGTATPKGAWKGEAYLVDGIPHYLMGHLSPESAYTAGDFVQDASALIEKIQAKGKTPVLVGGTGFYFKSLQEGLPPLPPRNPDIRGTIEKRMEKEGVATLHQELARVDPTAAGAITKYDRHKIIRALEIYELTGNPMSEWKNKKKAPLSVKFTVLGLDFSKELLDKRIEERSQHMFEHGMIEEAEALLKKGISADCPALISFGYKEAVEVIQGKMARKDFLPALIKGTKAYAKRQRTWFRTQTKPLWFTCDEKSIAAGVAQQMGEYLRISGGKSDF